MDKTRYLVSYGKCQCSYTPTSLEKWAWVNGYGPVYLDKCGGADDSALLATAVRFFCDRHFMFPGSAHLDCYDAETRGRQIQNWRYEPDGRFLGWIHAQVMIY